MFHAAHTDSLSLNDFLCSLSPLKLLSYKKAKKKLIQELKKTDKGIKGKKEL